MEKFQRLPHPANRSVTEINLLREQVRWLGSARRSFLTHLPKSSECSDVELNVLDGSQKEHENFTVYSEEYEQELIARVSINLAFFVNLNVLFQ